MLFEHDGFGVDSHTLGGVVRFVDTDESIGDLKHVVPQGDDDELSVLCLLLHRWNRRKRDVQRLVLHDLSIVLQTNASYSHKCNRPQWRRS